jgi:hypothetical protein
MIDATTTAGLAEIAARERDVAHAYEPGFVPEANDVAAAPRTIRSADPLSVAAPAGTYFLASGSGDAVRFTRDGSFALVDGMLCGPDGRAILGFPIGEHAKLGPLRVDDFDRALGRVSQACVDSDGTLSYLRTSLDPRTGERRIERFAVGKVAVARFPAGTQPLRLDATHVTTPPGTKARVGVPGKDAFAALVPGARDLGGVDIVAGLEKVREAYDTFAAARAARHAHGSNEKTTMDLVK